MKSVIHAISSWSGRKTDETPFCGSDDLERTVYAGYVTCPICLSEMCRRAANINAIRERIAKEDNE